MVPNNKYTAPKEHDTNAIRVPTTTNASLNPAHDQEIDLRWMNEQDVKSLQKSDPFMYYSIPGVLQASFNLEEVDYSDIASLNRHANSHPPARRPSRQLQEEVEDDADASASKVSRRTRISFECHPNVLFEGVMDEMEQEFGDDLDDIDIVSMLGSRLFGPMSSD